MLGPRRKEILVKGMTRNVRSIRLKHICDKEQIQEIVDYILQMRRQGVIDSYQEVGTTAQELLSWLA